MKPAWMAECTSAALPRKWCPERKQNTHKGDYGRILILAGAEGYTGAPALAAKLLTYFGNTRRCFVSMVMGVEESAQSQ